jgi:hypothetical protein
MFHLNFYWNVTAEPLSLEDDEDTYRMNSTTWVFWKTLTTDQIALAIILDIMTERF